MDYQTYYLLSLVIYLVIITVIGFWSHQRSQSHSIDPHLGGRSMNFWMTALSAHASDMSAWLFLSLPMLVWLHGAKYIWIAIGLWVGMGLNWLIVSKRLRIRTAAHGCSTLPAWLHHAFNDTHGWVRLLCSMMSTIFLMHYLAAGLIAMGLLTQQIFNLDYSVGTLIAVVVIAAYTMKGGFNAIAWVDLFQAIFLLVAIMLVPFMAWQYLPEGFSFITVVQDKNLSLNPWGLRDQTESWQAFFNALGWGLGYFGMPHILNKFMGIQSPKQLRKSMVVGMIWQFLALGASVAVGLVALGFDKLETNNAELLFLELVKGVAHPLVAGLIFCAIMAANLSTMDSQMLVTASVVEQDLLGRWLTGKSSTYKLLIFRLAIAAIALTAWLVASTRNPSVQAAVMYSWSGLGACYGPLVIWSLYAKPSHWLSACMAVITSALTVFIWENIQLTLVHLITPQTIEIPALVPGFMMGFLTLAGVEFVMRLRKRLGA